MLFASKIIYYVFMSKNELFRKIKDSILGLKDLSSFTLAATGEVSTLKGVLKVPVSGNIVAVRERNEIYLHGEISLLTYSYKGFYHNLNGNVSSGLNDKEEAFTGKPIDVDSIIEGVQKFLGTHYDDLNENEDGVLVLKLKEDATYDLMRQIGFNVSLVDKYLKESHVHDLCFVIKEKTFNTVTLTADAKLEGIPVEAAITVALKDIDNSQAVIQ